MDNNQTSALQELIAIRTKQLQRLQVQRRRRQQKIDRINRRIRLGRPLRAAPVHPIFKNRSILGQHASLFPMLLEDEKMFIKYMGMTIDNFYDLLDLLEPHLTGCISAEEQLNFGVR